MPYRPSRRNHAAPSPSSVHQVKDAGLLHEPPSRIGRHCDVAFCSEPESHNLKLPFNLF